MKPHKHAEVIRAWADGAQIECVDRGVWVECPGPTWQEYAEYRVKPEKVYPVTQMTDDNLSSAWSDCPAGFKGLRRFANAALRHAIDAGQIVTKDEHESALIQLGEHLRGIAIAPDAARDMAIAEAVKAEAMRLTEIYSTACHGQLRANLVPAAIIATIK